MIFTDPPTPVRVLTVVDLDTREVVFGVEIHNPYSIEFNGPRPYKTTDEVVRAYFNDMCSEGFSRKSILDNGPIPDSFEGRVCIVSEEEAAFKEYALMVKIIHVPKAASFNFPEEYFWFRDRLEGPTGWNAQLAHARGQSIDQEPAEQDTIEEDFWKILSETYLLVLFSVLISGLADVAHSAWSDKDN